jgi:hypothetical protein
MSYSACDHFRHHPPEPSDQGRALWQESWLTSWYDPLTRSGGYHHVDFQPARQRACVQSWVARGGEVLARYQSLNVPMPEYDTGGFTAGPLEVSTTTPLSAYTLRLPEAEAAFTGFTGPLEIHDNTVSDYRSPGTGHYEVFGRLAVAFPDGGTASAFAFHDHSWGPRDYGNLTATYRWGHLTFGEDLFAALYAMTTDRGRGDYGYVYDRGERHGVVRVDNRVEMAEDGHTPLAARLRVWTDSGRGYEFTGETDVSSVSSHDGGHFATETHGTWRCGGRLGAGPLAVRERGAPSAEHRDWLTAHEPRS